MRKSCLGLAFVLAVSSSSGGARSVQGCEGDRLEGLPGLSDGRVLEDGTVLGKGKVNINIDGYGRAYHPENAKAGALIHLCNAGEVFLPDGTKYHGSIDNQTCTGRFMNDVARIRAAGWNDPSVGAVRWYGILGRGEAGVGKSTVTGVKPVFDAGGSGFYVSPTALADETIVDQAVQRRYVHPLRIPAAVIPNRPELLSRGVVMGSFGVAYDPLTGKSVPFVVGDFGPRIGEATPALARSLAGLEITDNVTRANRYAGQVDVNRVVWVFFGKAAGKTTYDANNEQALNTASLAAFTLWGGSARLKECAE